MSTVPPGYLADTGWLDGKGIDAKTVYSYAKQGWVVREVQGVYRRPLASKCEWQIEHLEPWEVVLASVTRIMDYELHLGGLSALEANGLTENVELGDNRQIQCYGAEPPWIKRISVELPIRLQKTKLFANMPTGIHGAKGGENYKVPNDEGETWPYKLSTPERAILEELDELPKSDRFDILDKIFRNLDSLCPERLMQLLVNCTSKKVTKLFFVYAERHQHGWVKYLDKSQVRFGHGIRAMVKGGWMHPEYYIYLPRHFGQKLKPETKSSSSA